MFFQDSTDYFGGKTTTLKKTGPPCPFAGVLGRLGELAPVDVAGAFELAATAVVFEAGGDQLGVDTAPGELETEPRGAEARRLGAHVGVGEAGVGEQAELGETVELGLHLIGLAQAAELAGQLGAGVFPLGEAAQGTFVEAGGQGES